MALPFPVWVRRIAISCLCIFLAQETALWFLMNFALHNRIRSAAKRGGTAFFLGPFPLGVNLIWIFGVTAVIIFELGAYFHLLLETWRSYDHRIRKLARLRYVCWRYGKTRRADVYRSLDESKREIRVILIMPGGYQEDLACKVVYTHIRPADDTLPYEALSYTWGTMYSLQHIKLNVSPFAVTRNLEAALRRLRRPNRSRAIWVDALCIDQENYEERGKQVQMMKEIYENASEVIIWLGQGSPSTNCAMDFLDSASRQENPRNWFLSTVIERGLTYQDQWKAVILLWRKPYWRRVWIIQEIGYASQLAVLCGSKVISWDVIMKCQSAWAEVRNKPIAQAVRGKLPVMRGVSNLEQCALFMGLGTNKDDRDSLILALHTTRSAISTNEHQKGLIELLAMHRLALATDPRDRIYAIASLAGDCRSPPLPIDYTLPTWSVYLQTLKFLLDTRGNIDFLAFCGLGRFIFYEGSSPALNHYPWIPDFYWTSPFKYVPLDSLNLYVSGFATFHASGDRRASPQTKFLIKCVRGIFAMSLPAFAMSLPALRFEAFKVDTIRRTYYLNHSPSSKFFPEDFLHQLRAKLREQILESGESWVPEVSDQLLVEHIKALYAKITLQNRADGVTEEDMREAFLRTLTHNLTAEGMPAPPEWSSIFTVLINGPDFVPENFDFNVPGGSVNERAWAYVEPYVKAYRRLNLGARKLFITEKGRLGTTSWHGDCQQNIYVAPGCRMPMLITTTPNPDSENPPNVIKYGAVYLHSCMHGEAMTDLDTGVAQLQTFQLG